MANSVADTADQYQPSPQQVNKSSKTTTTTTTTTTVYTNKLQAQQPVEGDSSVASVEDLGKQAHLLNSSNLRQQQKQQQQQLTHKRAPLSKPEPDEFEEAPDSQEQQVPREGNRLVTSIGTLAAQSGQSRIVLALLRDGQQLQLQIQEMQPGFFQVGSNYKECLRYFEEQQRLVRNLRKQRKTPIEAWMEKYDKIRREEPLMSSKRKLVFLCMAENLQSCWRALLKQLEQRSHLLDLTCRFYEACEQLTLALDRADQHVQLFRQEFLAGSSSLRFNQACNELRSLNQVSLDRYEEARRRQRQLMELVGQLGVSNLNDSRPNHMMREAQQLNAYLAAYLQPFEQRRLQLESVITTTTSNSRSAGGSTGGAPIGTSNSSKTIIETRTETRSENKSSNGGEQQVSSRTLDRTTRSAPPPPPVFDGLDQSKFTTTTTTNNNQQTSSIIREISNFNDLNLVDNWLRLKIEQLNSSLLSSLGVNQTDSRSILNKHEQIALECRAIEEATLTFNGRNIHALKPSSIEPATPPGTGTGEQASLLEPQRALAVRTRDVITILEARIVLLRRTIDFYQRSKEATGDIGTMMRRLQVDNSLQSVQFVANELELKDVSSVVASGATIISELQQLQLAQQHGQRSRLVNLNLVTSGIRSIIDQLNQDLAHLKTVLNQRRLVLLNEDATKMAQNFANKCAQLQFWLKNHAKSYLLTNSGGLQAAGTDMQQVRAFCEGHEQLRVALQNKTLEVEALLRSLPTLSEHFDAKSRTADEIQRSTDELRQDWIATTNCLDKRIELSKKYLAILGQVAELERELEALERASQGRAGTPERTEEDIRSNVDQSFVQLANQVDRFREAIVKHQKSKDEGDADGANYDSQHLSDQTTRLLRQLTDRKSAVLEAIEARRVSSSSALDEKAAPAHQRPQQVLPPRFTRPLVDQAVEPFSSVELECETDKADCQVEWFMNNMKRIPAAVKHSTSSENNLHRLTISSFSPICSGTYQVRASNSAGQALSQCRLKLSGIQESVDEQPPVAGKIKEPFYNSSRRQQRQQQPASGNHFQVAPSSPALSTTSSFSQWRPNQNGGSSASATTTTTTITQTQTDTTATQTGGGKTIARLIQGVESSCEPESPVNSRQSVKISQLTSDSDTDTTNTRDNHDKRSPQPPEGSPQFPVTETTYSGEPRGQRGNKVNRSSSNSSSNNMLHPNYIASPISSTTNNTFSRSVSKSPFEGTPQPPVFVQPLADSIPHCCSRAGLVAIVVGNPPPTIEWLHNDQLIATAKCPQRPAAGGTCARGSLCKLVIETMNRRTQGDYVCRASNRLGQSSSGVSVAKL